MRKSNHKQGQFNSNTHEFDEDELFDHNQQQWYNALTARSGRQVKRPSTFDDFVCNYS
jgi:hypothetical protein